MGNQTDNHHQNRITVFLDKYHPYPFDKKLPHYPHQIAVIQNIVTGWSQQSRFKLQSFRKLNHEHLVPMIVHDIQVSQFFNCQLKFDIEYRYIQNKLCFPIQDHFKKTFISQITDLLTYLEKNSLVLQLKKNNLAIQNSQIKYLLRFNQTHYGYLERFPFQIATNFLKTIEKDLSSISIQGTSFKQEYPFILQPSVQSNNRLPIIQKKIEQKENVQINGVKPLIRINVTQNNECMNRGKYDYFKVDKEQKRRDLNYERQRNNFKQEQGINKQSQIIPISLTSFPSDSQLNSLSQRERLIKNIYIKVYKLQRFFHKQSNKNIQIKT